MPLNRARYSCLVILLTAALFISGCTSPPASRTTPAEDDSLTIMTSFYPVYIIAINVCQDVPGVRVINLTKPQTGCLHDYQLTPEDVKTLEQADAFIINGAGMESFLDQIIKQQPNLKIITASKGIDLLKDSGSEEANPHVWVSPEYAIKQVINVGEGLAAVDPAHAEQYRANAATYATRLEDFRTEMHRELAQIKCRDIVTMHEAFPYFAREFNLHTVAVIEREPGSEPDAATLAATIEAIKKSAVKAVFAEPQYPTNAAEAIARETSAKVYILDPSVSGSMSPDAYIKIMQKNLITLKEALNQ